MQVYPSKLIEDSVNAFARFPGIGKKTALRMTLHLLNQDENFAEHFGNAVVNLKKNICHCKICHNISDQEICNVCSNPMRDEKELCIVADMRDVMAIENTAQYKGKYHVLNGLIAPMDGIGPDHLNIGSLVERIENQQVTEVIMALSATMDGDTTAFYISKLLKEKKVKISTIARGISVGGELEYADEITLGRSIANRIPL